MELQEASVDDIKAPTRTDKLHPHENEDQDEWKEFKSSIEDEVRDPLKVKENGDGYELIDGDRRLRAAEEVDRDTVPVLVEDDVDTDPEKITKMIASNEHRKPSDKKQRSHQTARLVQPWLLPPGDRLREMKDAIENGDDDVRVYDQTEFAEEVGKSKGTVSRWLTPMKDEHMLRSTLGATASGNYVSGEDIELIDNIVDTLTGGKSKVVPVAQEQFVATELDEMEGVTLREINSTAEKAVDEGWDTEQFLEYIENEFAYDEMQVDEGDVDAGMLGDGEDRFEDDSEAESHDGEYADDIVDEGDSGSDEDESTVQRFTVDQPANEIDWEDLDSQTDLSTDEDLSEITSNKMVPISVMDDAAIALQYIQAVTGKKTHEVVTDFIEPLIIDQAVGRIRGEIDE